ncbi:hypothetical protein ABT246_25770 [Streptomyces sp. NPDC001553]|uniref:hypothetical protein n=1 Tax=Streptomyces sp. NPDC001553 TaxID=3154385 RepID=UPI003320B29B
MQTERQRERFAVCWRHLQTGRPYPVLALTDDELERHGQAFGDWLAVRCAAAGFSPEETARRLEHGSVAGVLEAPDAREEGGEPEAYWYWAARQCKVGEIGERFRAGMKMASAGRSQTVR